MHTLRNRIFFYGTALAAGVSSLMLHRYMMEYYLDDKGLLIAGNLPGRLLWIIGMAAAAVVLYLIRGLGGDGTYAESFPRSFVSGGLMIAAGAALLWELNGSELIAGGTGMSNFALLPAVVMTAVDGCMQVLPYAAAGAMAVLGVYRLLGRRPSSIFALLICLFYVLMLVIHYQEWSADPRLGEYAHRFLAGVLLMLCSFHRASCDAGVIQRKKLLVTGLMAALCAIASLSGEEMRRFYLASALWALGCTCSAAVFPPDSEPEEEETEDQPEEQSEEQPEET